MSFFNPEIPIKEKPITKHPWEQRIKDKYSGRYKHAHNSIENPVYPVPKAEDPLAESRRVKFIIIGNRVTKEFIYCQHLVKGLYKYRKKQFRAPIIRGVTSVEWPKVWNDLKIQFGRAAYCLKGQAAVLLDNEFLGGEDELRNVVETKYIYQYPEYLDYYKEGIEQFSNYVKSFGRPCAYLHICINDVPIGPLIFMLYADIAPLTCQNFINLCESKRGGYSGTPIHRIVQDGWIQCGGFGLDNQNTLDCENYIVPHDRRGVLCMANDGRNKDCSTQFFVLLQPANWMKYKYVAFGQLIEGEQSLQKIENSPTWCESPTDKIIIYRTGVFNMECLWRPINRTANEYISGHIEDLVQLGILFYDIILENLYAALDEKLQALEDEEPEVIKEIHPTKRAGPVRHVTAAASENNEFDVEVYDEYEGEEGDSGMQDTCVLADETPKSSRVLEQPYYLPLTDVPYPGEIESAFNLQRLLRGDYSLEADLIMDQEERKKGYTVREKLTVPEELLDALFEYFEPDVRSESSLESDEEKTIKNYIKEHVDTTSFAGPIIKKMANLNAKYQLFEVEEDKIGKEFLTDEDLRLFRVAAKEINSQRHKKVSISASTALASHTCIQRRPTGFVRKEDIDMLDEIIGKFMENREEEQMDDIDREVKLRQVQIESNKPSGEKGAIKRRQTGFVRAGDDEPRTSALLRLYDEVSMSDEEEVPTLKGYRPTSETHQNTYKYLTHSPLSLLEDKGDRVVIHRYDNEDTLGDTLNLQHGKKLSRKMSSDYANTLTRLEHPPNSSLRSIEYAKQRPSLSVVEYKQKNQKYQEEMGKF